MVAALAPVAAALAMAACSSSNDTAADDPRRAQIGGVAELAVNAYASAGPEALYDYVSSAVTAKCSKQDLVAALQDETTPTAFRELKDVSFDGDKASATIIISTGDGEQDIVWTYLQDNGHWRISEMPGLESCTS
jgi:hypothetical protein